jgi:hypothetical protein
MNHDPNMTDAGSRPEETPEALKYRITTHADQYWTLRNKLMLLTTLISVSSLLVSLFSLSVSFYLARVQRILRTQDLGRQEKLRQDDLAKQESSRKQEYKWQMSLKEIDIREYCQKRYDELDNDARKNVKNRNDAKGYYKRFWDLQNEEYQYCKDGVIDSKIFGTWMASRWRENRDNDRVGPMRYQDGWKYVEAIFKKNDRDAQGDYSEFVNFMNAVFKGNEVTCNPAPKIP